MLLKGKDPYEVLVPLKHPRTCNWIRSKEKFVTWRDAQGPALLLLLGESGQGKSVLARSLLDDLSQRSEEPSTILGFFCKSGVKDRNDSACVLKSWLYRLLVKHEGSFRLATKHVPSTNLLEAGLPVDNLWNLFIDVLSDAPVGNTYIILDGLDECEEESQQYLLRRLKEIFITANSGFSSLSAKVHFLITSQPTAIVKRESQQMEKVLVENSDVGPDIVTFIKSGVTDLALDDGHSHTIRDLVQQRLENGAEGTFLWASLVLDELNNIGDDITLNRIYDALEGTPQRLEDHYIHVWQRIVSYDRAKPAATILNILLSAQRSFSPDELSVAFFLAMAPEEDITHLDIENGYRRNFNGYAKRVCGSFIKSSETRIEIVHQSARSFLLGLASKPKHSSLSTFFYESSQVHDFMSRICLQYLLLESLDSSKLGVYEKYPFLAYAERNWTHHVRESADHLVESRQLLKKFFDLEKSTFLSRLLRSSRLIEEDALDNISIMPDVRASLHTIIYFRLPNVIEQSRIGNQHPDNPLLQLDIRERTRFGRTPLHSALAVRDDRILHQLLACGANPDLADQYGFTPLHDAVRQSRLSAVELLCEAGENLEHRTDSGETPLLLAALMQENHIFEWLLTKGANIAHVNNDGWSVFHAAARNGDMNMVDQLLRLGVDPKAKLSDGRTSLHLAAQEGHAMMVTRLVQLELDTDAESKHGVTPLLFAASYGHLKVIDQLVDLEVDPQAKTKVGWTALHMAAREGHLAVVDRLAELNVDINATSSTGITAFHLAARNGHIAVLNRLLGLKVDYQAKTDTGWTALHFAAQDDHVDVVDRLVELSVDLNATSNAGSTALHIAAHNGHVAVLNRLLDLKVDPQTKSQVGWTALHHAAQEGKLEIINRLAECHVDLEVKSKDGWTALYLAAEGGHVDVLDRLLALRVNPNRKSVIGRTALHGAAIRGHATVIDRLIKVGSDVKSSDYFDTSPVHLAVYHGRIEGLKRLIAAGGDLHQLDGFGRSALDWAQDYPPALQTMGSAYDDYKPTERITSTQRCKKIMQKWLASPQKSHTWFDRLGRVLVHIGRNTDAEIAFNLSISSAHKATPILHTANCDLCGMDPIEGNRYACRHCADTDLCETCHIKYSNGETVRTCRGHTFMKIPSVTWETTEPPGVDTTGRTSDDWLKTLVET